MRWRVSFGDVLNDLNDFQAATAQDNAATRILPNYPAALIATAGLRLDTGEAARAEVERAVRAGPGLWQTLTLQGRLAAREGDYEAAEKHFAAALAASPDNYRVQIAHASARIRAGDCTEAKALLEKQVEARPRLAELHEELAQTYICLEDSKKALVEAEKAAELNPYDPWIRSTLAGAQKLGGRAEEVLTSYALAGAATDYPLYFIREAGLLYLAESRLPDAEGELALAFELMHGDPETGAQLCLARLAQDKFVEAAEACRAALTWTRKTRCLTGCTL